MYAFLIKCVVLSQYIQVVRKEQRVYLVLGEGRQSNFSGRNEIFPLSQKP